MSLQRRHLATSLSASSFSLVLTNDRIDGCPPGVDLGTKKGEVDERIAEVEGPVAEEWVCGPPPEPLVPMFPLPLLPASSILRASLASLLSTISMMDLVAIRMISGVVFKQGPTSNPGILARWYFKRLIPP